MGLHLNGIGSALTDQRQITGIGRSLYDLLRAFSGYRAAIVRWNPESLVDLEDLEFDWRNGDPRATTA